MNFLVQFTKIAILKGACAQLLLGGIHRCGHFSGAFQMTYFFRRVWAAPGGNRAAWGVSRCGVFCGPYFPVFGVDAGICSVGLRIRSGCWGGVRTGGALYLGTFRAVSLGRYFTVHVQALTQRALFLYSLKTSKYSLKTSKSLWLSDVFKKYKKEMRNEKWINV